MECSCGPSAGCFSSGYRPRTGAQRFLAGIFWRIFESWTQRPSSPGKIEITRRLRQLRLRCILRCSTSFGEECGAGAWGLERAEFDRILLLAARAQNPPPAPVGMALKEQQGTFLRSLKLSDLVLAKACAAGNDRAWEQFMAQYGQPLTRAAIAISGSETVGRDLADAFYAELYGLNIARWRAQMSAGFVSREGLAAGLAADDSGAALRGSLSAHVSRTGAG